MESIVEEISFNQGMVAEAVTYHSMLLDTLQGFIYVHGRSPSIVPPVSMFYRGFTSPAPVISRAWEVASATGVVEYIPYEDVLTVSRLYENQNRYEEQSEMISHEIYGQIFQHGYQGILQNYQNLFAVIGTFLYRECELLQAYSDVLPQYVEESTVLEIPEACSRMPKR